MKNLQNDFLKRSVTALKNLAKRAKNEAVLSPEFVREAFRILHTIKGTSQTFGFSNSSKIAHELENLLADAKEKNDYSGRDFKPKLLEGIAYLVDSFTKNSNTKARKSFVGKTQKADVSALPFEPEFLNQFSEHERKEIVAQVNSGKNIFFVNADFDAKNFAEGFKNLREKLSEEGEIIAALSNPKATGKNKISFRICFASDKNESQIRQIFVRTACGSGLVRFCNENQPATAGCSDILSQIVAHGKDLAKKSGKEIDFEISAEKIKLSPEKSNLIFDILLHLTRNAIDHAFEKKGMVKISIKSAKDGLKLFVKDNGKGIDAKKVRAKAIEKKIISPAKTLTESEMLDLIFLHDFSTAEVLTEISGRGVGLDAVKNLVENARGTINVKSRRESGTIFEVILRYEE